MKSKPKICVHNSGVLHGNIHMVAEVEEAGNYYSLLVEEEVVRNCAV